MNRNQRRSRLGFVLLGSCLVATISAAPASAALSSGGFFVHAQNIQSPEFEATAGMGGIKSEGSTPDPGSGGDSASSADFSAGPLSLKVTPEMLAFSEANRKAQEEGRTGDIKTSPEGWQTIWSIRLSDQSTHPGILDDPDTSVVLLSKVSTPTGIEAVGGLQSDPNSPIRALYIKMGAVIQGYDYRGTPKDGATFSYADTGAQRAEGRYAMVNGKLIAIYVLLQSDGGIQVYRGLTPNTIFDGLPNNDGMPYLFTIDAGGNVTDLSVKYPDASRGYTRFDLNLRPDLGGYVIQYRDRTDGGPTLLVIDSDTNRPKSANYIDESGTEKNITIDSAADYNAQTGRNWDGKFDKFSDFDTAVPFRPTKP